MGIENGKEVSKSTNPADLAETLRLLNNGIGENVENTSNNEQPRADVIEVPTEVLTSGTSPLESGDTLPSPLDTADVAGVYEDTETHKRIGNHRHIIFRTESGNVYHLSKNPDGTWQIHDTRDVTFVIITDKEAVRVFEDNILAIDSNPKIKEHRINLLVNGKLEVLKTNKITQFIKAEHTIEKTVSSEMPLRVSDALRVFPQGIHVAVKEVEGNSGRYFSVRYSKESNDRLIIQEWNQKGSDTPYICERETIVPANACDVPVELSGKRLDATALRAGGSFLYYFSRKDTNPNALLGEKTAFTSGARQYTIENVEPLE